MHIVDRDSKVALAIIGPNRDKTTLSINDNGELANSVNSNNTLIVPPKKSVEYDLLFVLYPLNHELIDILRKHKL